jgi:hypothetical protein
MDRATLQQALTQAGKQRIAEAKSAAPAMINVVDAYGDEASDYYRTARGAHPNCANEYMARSVELLAGYDSFADWISPRPLLMITGSEAVTRHLSRQAMELAQGPKELVVLEGKRHTDLYDGTSETVPKVVDFMVKALCA